MHDVAKPAQRLQVKSPVRRILIVVLWLFLLVALVAGLKAAGISGATMVVTVLAVIAVVSGIMSFRRFREGRTTLGALLAVLCLFCVLAGIKASQVRKMMSTPFAMPPTAVSSAVVKLEDWPPTLDAVGSISPVQGAIVATELGGVVAEIDFQNGGTAKRGEVLMKLDTSAEEGLLKNARADLELARANLERTRDLANRKVVSKQDLDAAESAFGQKQGTVDNINAIIRKKQVVAPFDGQLGIRQVNVGQTVNAGQQVVALTALDPVYVDFALPQQELSKLSDGLEVKVNSDAVPDHEFKGKLTAIDPMVDSITRNVSLQGTIGNPEHSLHPGMFAKVQLVLPQKQKTLVIPGSAVSYAPYGNSVYVIETKKDPKTDKDSQVLREQIVRVGQARGDFIAVDEGLKEGETIVSTGVFKLRNGIPVVVNNDLAPKPKLNPTPPDT